jgi:alpha-tubulin suppressor-like RCC1 family protein
MLRFVGLLVAVGVMAGCNSGDDDETCGPGGTCPQGYTCNNDNVCERNGGSVADGAPTTGDPDGGGGPGDPDARPQADAAAQTTVQFVGMGKDITCAVLSTGSVRCWGANEQGQVGMGEVTGMMIQTPTPVLDMSGASSVDCGLATCCAAMSSGGVQCWGWNDQGLLGVNQTRDQFNNRPMPAAVLAQPNGGTVDELSGVDQVTLGWAHACARRGSDVWCWGWNQAGQCGRDNSAAGGETSILVAKPSVVTEIAELGMNSQFSEFNCAINAGGQVVCWGLDFQGQLGDGAAGGVRYTPAPVTGIAQATAVATGRQHACAIAHPTDSPSSPAGVYCWGLSDTGQTGPGGTGNQATPVLVPGLEGSVAVAAGQAHSCAILDTGAVRCWGDNASGQLGDGTTVRHAEPADVLSPDGTGSLLGAAQLAAGLNNTCAIAASGDLFCWGENNAGQLGQGGGGPDSSVPVEVPVLE